MTEPIDERPTANSALQVTYRSWWLALLLTLISPVFGMLYCNRGRRATAYFLVSLAALCIASLAVLFGFWRYSVAFFPLVVAVSLYGIVDTYRIAKNKEMSKPLQWYARWYGLASVLGFSLTLVLASPIFLETFRIRAGSMMPTLMIGDMIIVNKLAYKFDQPGVQSTMSKLSSPALGDVIVFRYPPDPALIYIKRVVGGPGDRVTYIEKQLKINDREASLTPAIGEFRYVESGNHIVSAKRFAEKIGETSHDILQIPESPPIYLSYVKTFSERSACEYSKEGFNCVVPAGHYLVLGDNRDSSADSRYWGFVPEANILGKAMYICASEGRGFQRMGKRIQ